MAECHRASSLSSDSDSDSDPDCAGCGLKIMYIRKKDISRRDAKAQSQREEERHIK